MSVHHRFHLLNVNINKKKKKKQKKEKDVHAKYLVKLWRLCIQSIQDLSVKNISHWVNSHIHTHTHTHTHTLTHENFATVGATKWVVSLSGVESGIFVWGGQVQR